MKIDKKPSNPAPAKAVTLNQKSPTFWTALLLLLLLALLFWRCFIPSNVLFSNDGPYGAMVQEYNRMPSILRGMWANMNWFGGESVAPPASVSSLMRILTTPLIYAKILCPVALLIAGVCACFCFRKLRLAPVACILGGLAAGLNSDFFSTSCWGVSTQVIGFGFMFLAIGLIADPSIKRQWLRVILAGFAVGIGVMEAYDIGALFSLVVAAFVIYHEFFLVERPAETIQKVNRGALRLLLVAGFAMFVAAHSLISLVATQIQGIQGTGQDEQSRQARWEYATSYSTPKLSTLQVFIPGIVGYRDNWYMYDDRPKADQYWTDTNMHPIGTGYYASVPVVVIAFWAFLQSLRRKNSPFTTVQRRAIWFWTVVAIIGLLLAWGNYAPFYQFFYALPFASTIRAPQKFMHIMSWALLFLFAYGVHGLAVAYLQNYVARVGGFFAQLKSWLGRASIFERVFWLGSTLAIIAAIAGWTIYSNHTAQVSAYLQTIGVAATDAPSVAKFSVAATGWFALLLALTMGCLTLIFTGLFSGSRAKWAAVMLGALMMFDLGRADAPWISYWDLDYKYAKDPIVEFLADKPYEHRVAMVPQAPPNASQETQMNIGLLYNEYQNDWKQHLFPFYNIQCAEVVQEPRMPVDKATYLNYFPPANTLRFFQYSNTRYLLAATDLFKLMDPQEKNFKILKTFDMVPKVQNPDPQHPADWYSQVKPDGHLAVAEYLAALPRAKLYSHWELNTNDTATLQKIAGPSFDLFHDVMVDDEHVPQPVSAVAPDADPGTVQIDPNYKSKRIEMHADTKLPAVLLLSERYSPKWKVEVDGKPEQLLKCNFIERGVYLTPGKHDIVMYFAPANITLWISLAAIVIGLGMWGYLIFSPSVEEQPVVASPVETPKEKPEAKV